MLELKRALDARGHCLLEVRMVKQWLRHIPHAISGSTLGQLYASSQCSRDAGLLGFCALGKPAVRTYHAHRSALAFI